MKNAMLIILSVILTIGTVQAEGDPAAGKQKSAKCAGCHGPNGNSASPNFPRLAGQYEDYVILALESYKSGARTNPIMKGMAAPLSKQDIEDLAAYYSQQKGLVSPDAGADFAY
jgi:cytochrome c553